MFDISAEVILLILSVFVIVSYLFSIVSKFIRVPSVLLLLATGIVLRIWANDAGVNIVLPGKLTEFLGIVGLLMIVLEAGLDLKLSSGKVVLIRQSFLAATIIFFLSMLGIAGVIYLILKEPLLKCIVYAIPLAIMSSSIVIPSLHQLSSAKKEFLTYEASFSDIIGILVFNYFIGDAILSASSIGLFFLNILLSVLLSILFSFILFLILNKTTLNIKFFLVFALLIFLYVGGKMLHLPSLIIILVFGLLMNNWSILSDKIRWLNKYFAEDEVKETTHFLHSITAETSFLLRTFFFIVFGYSINVSLINNGEVILIGGLIIIVLLLTRFLYLRFFLKERIYPEVFFVPRGLITVLLFYKIPESLQLPSFNLGILFFVILISSLILMIGMIFYKQPSSGIIEED
ncbi:MAG: cation:proton antiporter [Bacteroidota bacterium]|nr:cation:proton antiporter [Bacteroidota bacterium]